MSKDNNFLRKLYDNFQLIPCNSDKTPAVNGSWKPYKEKKFNFEKLKRSSYFGLITGLQGLEIVDVDNHFQDASDLFQFISDNFDLSSFPIVKTGGGGYHLYFKTPKPGGNTKLASRLNSKNRPETLVETRGTGGYVIAPPSPNYEIIQGNIFDLPELSENQRDELLEICQALNEYDSEPIPEPEPNTDNTEAPGTQYNESMEAMEKTAQLLKNAGWKTKNGIHFTRPGKKKGISATLGKVPGKFYVFSSNAAPFEPFRSYSPFAVKSLLEFNGNFSEAAKELAKEYGTHKTPQTKQTTKSKSGNKNKWDLLQDVLNDFNIQLKYNLLTKTLQATKNGEEIDLKILLADIAEQLETEKGVKSIGANKINEMLTASRYCELYNPLENFFKSLPKYNGKSNFDDLMQFIEVPPDENKEFVAQMLKKHLIRAIKCAKEPEYSNRIVLVEHGGQEIGKSRKIEWMLPRNELYSSENIDLTDKDTYLMLAQNLLINLEELDQLNKKELNKLKAFIVKDSVKKRLPWGKEAIQFNRIASFIASTNETSILTDVSNTRWLFVKIDSIDWKQYPKHINPWQLWSEAMEAYKQNSEAGELTEEEKKERNRRNDKDFIASSNELEIIQKYFSETEPLAAFTVSEIHQLIEQKLYPLKINNYQLRRELRRVFGEPKNTTINGRKGRFYHLNTTLSNEYEDYRQKQFKDEDKENVPF